MTGNDRCDAGVAISIIKKMKYHEEYKRMLSHPEESTNGLSFDGIIDNLRPFYLIRPILPSNNNHAEYCLHNFLKIPSKCGLSPVSIDQVVAMGSGGLAGFL